MVGLTLSRNQQAHAQQLLDQHPSARSKRVLLHGWEQFDEKVDRIVSIGAFEHFGRDRYPDFFTMAYEALPADGVMLLNTIIKPSDEEFAERRLPMTMIRFIAIQSQEVYDRSMKYLTGCADLFREGFTDVAQFTLAKG